MQYVRVFAKERCRLNGALVRGEEASWMRVETETSPVVLRYSTHNYGDLGG